jgi:hypothetical protein
MSTFGTSWKIQIIRELLLERYLGCRAKLGATGFHPDRHAQPTEFRPSFSPKSHPTTTDCYSCPLGCFPRDSFSFARISASMGAAAFRQYPPCIQNAPELKTCRVFAFFYGFRAAIQCGLEPRKAVQSRDSPGVESLSLGNTPVKIA